jgi:hypothetical protein
MTLSHSIALDLETVVWVATGDGWKRSTRLNEEDGRKMGGWTDRREFLVSGRKVRYTV